jgi:hypothetical protein
VLQRVQTLGLGADQHGVGFGPDPHHDFVAVVYEAGAHPAWKTHGSDQLAHEFGSAIAKFYFFFFAQGRRGGLLLRLLLGLFLPLAAGLLAIGLLLLAAGLLAIRLLTATLTTSAPAATATPAPTTTAGFLIAALGLVAALARSVVALARSAVALARSVVAVRSRSSTTTIPVVVALLIVALLLITPPTTATLSAIAATRSSTIAFAATTTSAPPTSALLSHVVTLAVLHDTRTGRCPYLGTTGAHAKEPLARMPLYFYLNTITSQPKLIKSQLNGFFDRNSLYLDAI